MEVAGSHEKEEAMERAEEERARGITAGAAASAPEGAC